MKLRKLTALPVLIIVLALGLSLQAFAAGEDTVPMHRLYNPNSGEHFYTGSEQERNDLTVAGWLYEGIAWDAPVYSGAPVHRLFNPNSGDHHYTMSADEMNMLIDAGWQYENVCWNSAGDTGVALFRMWNPNADLGSHHYTNSTEERDNLVAAGWIFEGIGWYGAAPHTVHDMVTEITVAPTCTQVGVSNSTCTVCGYIKTTRLPALGHDLSKAVTKNPTCTENGVETTACSRCDYQTTSPLPAAHTPKITVIEPPTCDYGFGTAVCEVCGLDLGDTAIDPVHTPGRDEIDGEYTAHGCTKCDYVFNYTYNLTQREAAEAMLVLVNELRVSRGLNPLVLDETLCENALERAHEIELDFSHTGADYGENIARGHTTIEDHFRGWYNSPGHLANMLEADYETFGYGYYHPEYTNGKGMYSVQTFWW